jgi:hypothetical protein
VKQNSCDSFVDTSNFPEVNATEQQASLGSLIGRPSNQNSSAHRSSLLNAKLGVFDDHNENNLIPNKQANNRIIPIDSMKDNDKIDKATGSSKLSLKNSSKKLTSSNSTKEKRREVQTDDRSQKNKVYSDVEEVSYNEDHFDSEDGDKLSLGNPKVRSISSFTLMSLLGERSQSNGGNDGEGEDIHPKFCMCGCRSY